MASDADRMDGEGRDRRTGRFQKGHSGNQGGRPKKIVLPPEGPVSEAFEERVVVPKGRRSKRMTLRQVSATQLVHKSAKGDMRAHKLAEDLRARERAEVAAARQAAPAELTETDQQIVERFVARLRRIFQEEANGADPAAP
jgi:hypothetical protein